MIDMVVFQRFLKALVAQTATVTARSRNTTPGVLKADPFALFDPTGSPFCTDAGSLAV